MANLKCVGYNPSQTPISGTEQIGDLVIGETDQQYYSQPGGIRFWATPDLDLGYVIAHVNQNGDQPNPLGIDDVHIGFWRSEFLTTESFITLAQNVSNWQSTPQIFANADDAKTWLNDNGYWTSYVNVTPTPNILFLGDGLVSTIAGHVSNYITATGHSITYSAVTMGTTYTGSGNITPANYDAVVMYTNASQTGNATLSSALTSYVNAGGNVISGVFLWNLYPSGFNHSGTTAFNATNSQSNISSPAAFTVSTPSVITNGIGTSFGELVLTNSNPTLSSGSTLYASYNTGSVRLLAVKEVGSSKLVSINTSFTNINSSTETLTKMVGNAILYATGVI
jgi:hypothetical protein